MSEATMPAPAAPQPAQGESQTIGQRIKDFVLGTTLVGFIIRGTLIPLLLYLLIFIFGVWRAWADADGSAAYFDYVRGLFDVIVSLASILIIIAIGVLIVQIARFVNLLRSEVKPITEDTKQAIKNVRVTSEFVQKNAVKPVIKTQTFIAGILAFLREIGRISKILQRRNTENEGNKDG
ncbi:MAG: hypothetical protein WBC91_04355 [Phototrophicaceae bacterium]